MKFTQPHPVALKDRDAEAVRQNTDRRIGELQRSPMAEAVVLRDVVLPDGVGVQVPHGLGRRPRAHFPSSIRGAATAGVIQDFLTSTPSNAPNDLSQTLSLRAIDFGADITVDILVVL